MPEEAVADLRRRIGAARLPSQELVDDRSQGVQLATIRELARYWAGDYDWRACEARLNALPQCTTAIDGVDIHFIHVRSPHENALPLIMTHGWPGRSSSCSGPSARSPTLPRTAGPRPTRSTWYCRRCPATDFRRAGRGRLEPRPHRAGVGGADAPPGLHPLRRPGRRRGRRHHRRHGPPGARRAGRHSHEPAGDRAGRPQPTDTGAERAAAQALATFRTSGIGYLIEQDTRPQTIGYALLDSPFALAARMLDHDTDS
jgi:Epoxide hydrolase N terminus